MVYVRALLIALLAIPALAEELPVLWTPPAGFPPTLRDIASRLPRDTDAKDADLITYAHEGNHFLCRGKPGFHRIYIGGGRRWDIPTPPLLTEEVFARIPEAHRTSIYQIYLRQGRHEYWATQPLMLLDEWRAYTVGSLVRQELGLKTRAETVAHAKTMARFCKQLHNMAQEIPEYDITELTKFCRWNLGECYRIEGFDTEVTFD